MEKQEASDSGSTQAERNHPAPISRATILALVCLLALFAIFSVIGITWGLPSRNIDYHLFGGEPAWSGEKIYRLAHVEGKFASDLGADVDPDPLEDTGDEPILLTGSESDVAKIYLRYRLYTHQPDEMITLMSLAGMKPRSFDFDPRLYQYGGLFIYPVGAFIKLSGMLGLIDVRGDIVYYLDNPEEFGKFYIVARAYVAAWGLVGVLIVFGIARRLGGNRVGIIAALLFTLMPVVVCMAHEGKPHLPGAVLMLAAVLFAMRHLGIVYTVENPNGLKPAAQGGCRRCDWWMLCICCGASLGMVLTSAPVFILIPLTAWLVTKQSALDANVSGGAGGALATAARRTLAGVALALGVYLITNPYVLINAIFNREVIASNFGNSMAMYNVSRIGEGFIRVLELSAEGATAPIVLLGFLALALVIRRRHSSALLLVVPAGVFFLQFVLIGAGKPAEYGRFGIFPDTALAIGTACLIGKPWTRLRGVVNWVPTSFVVLWVSCFGGAYLWNFHADASSMNSRIHHAAILDSVTVWPKQNWTLAVIPVAVLAEPAPYSCPPLCFARYGVRLYASREQLLDSTSRPQGTILVEAVDIPENPSRADGFRPLSPAYYAWQRHQKRPFGWPIPTPISWANKPFLTAYTWPY